MLEARRNVTSTIASQGHVNSLAENHVNSLAEARLRLPEGLSSGVHPPPALQSRTTTSRPEQTEEERGACSRPDGTYVYSVSASAKTELLAAFVQGKTWSSKTL